MLWLHCKDLISRDKKVCLEGWISNSLWRHSPVSSLEVEFYLEDEKIGEAKSNEKGEFFLEHEFESQGLYQIMLNIKEAPSKSTILTALILSNNNEKPLTICDIDHTIVNFSFFRFLFGKRLYPIKGAKDTLNSLQNNYHLIYLTHRDKRFSALTKKWLKIHQIPFGPVFFWSINEDPFLSAKYKIRALQKIQEQSKLSLEIGIGDRLSDMKAYSAMNIPNRFLIKKGEQWQKIMEVFK